MCTEMVKKKKEEKREIEIPGDVEVRVENGNKIIVKGEKGQVEKKIKPKIKVSKKENTLILSSPTSRRKDKSLLGTAQGDIKNMIHGVTEGVVYKLKVVYSHFPVNLKVQGNELWIENFFGERCPRKARILEGVDVKINGQDIEVIGIDKERVGQTQS